MVPEPILVFPDWNKEFHVHVDASSIALGVVLAQPSDDDLDHPCFCKSEVIIRKEELYKHGAQGASDGLRATEIQALPSRRSLQDVY